MTDLNYGYTIEELYVDGSFMKEYIIKNGYPEGTTSSEWLFIGEMAVYRPYLPLYCTGMI